MDFFSRVVIFNVGLKLSEIVVVNSAQYLLKSYDEPLYDMTFLAC